MKIPWSPPSLGGQIGYATCYAGGNSVDPLELKAPRIRTMKTAKFVVFQDKKKQWRWSLVAANGQKVAQGESHKRRADAVRAMKRLGDLCIQALCRHLRETGKMGNGL